MENCYFGENGLVYNIATPTERILYLSNIGSISSGDDHYLANSLDGYVFSFGTGNLGQLGNGKNSNSVTPVVVRTDSGYLTDVINVSAGTKTSMALSIDRKGIFFWR